MDLDLVSRKKRRMESRKKKKNGQKNSGQAQEELGEGCLTSTNHMNIMSTPSLPDERNDEGKVLQLVTDETNSFPVTKALPNLSHESDKALRNANSFSIDKIEVQDTDIGVDSTQCPSFPGIEQNGTETSQNLVELSLASRKKRKRGSQKKIMTMQDNGRAQEQPDDGCCTSINANSSVMGSEAHGTILGLDLPVCLPFAISEQTGVETVEDPAVVNRVSQEKSKRSQKKKTRALQNSEQAGKLPEESGVTSAVHMNNLSMPSPSGERGMEENPVVVNRVSQEKSKRSQKKKTRALQNSEQAGKLPEESGVTSAVHMNNLSMPSPSGERVMEENPAVVNRVSQEKSKRSQKKKTRALQNSEQAGKLPEESGVTSTVHMNNLSMPSPSGERGMEEKVTIVGNTDSVPTAKSGMQDVNLGVESTTCPSTTIEQIGMETAEDPAVVNWVSQEKSKRSQKKKTRALQNSEQAGKLPEESGVTSGGHMNNLSMPSPSGERGMEEKVTIVGNTDSVPTAKSEMQDVNLGIESTTCPPTTIEQIGVETAEDPAVVNRVSQEKSKRSQKKKTRALQNSEQAGKLPEESGVTSAGHMNNLSMPSPSGDRGMEEKVIIVGNTDSVLTAKSEMQDINVRVESTTCPPATIEQIGVETAKDHAVVNRVSQKKSKRSQKKKTRALQNSEQAGKLPEESGVTSVGHMDNLSMPSPSGERGMEEKVIIVGNTDPVPAAKSEMQDVNLGVESTTCPPSTMEQIGVKTAEDPAVVNRVSQEKSKRSQKKKTRAVQNSEQAGNLPEESFVTSTGHMNNLSMPTPSDERDTEEKVIVLGSSDSVPITKSEKQDMNLGVDSTTCPTTTIEQMGVETVENSIVVNLVSQEKSKRSLKKKTRALQNGEQAGMLPEESCVTSTTYTNILSMPSSSDERDTEEKVIVLGNTDSVPITKIKAQDANLGAESTTCPPATIEQMGGEATKNPVEMNMVIKKKIKQRNRKKPNMVVNIHQVPKEAPLTNSDGVNIMSTVRLSNGKDSEGKIISLGAAGNEQVSLAVDNEEDNSSEISHISLVREPAGHLKKKLLILDINGLLADIVRPPPKNCTPDTKVAGHAIFKRPFCRDFLKFCFERFEVGVWSSRSKKNVQRVIDYLMGDMKHKLLLCWDLSYCTATKFKTREHRHKLIVFKDLRKIWEKQYPTLRWEKGEYNESNTLLLDDSPYKALLNPRHTAIFPYSYKFRDKDDRSLGSGGDLRVYLEKLAEAENTPNYVANHPFGQNPITQRSKYWDFYQTVISSLNPHQPRDNVSG